MRIVDADVLKRKLEANGCGNDILTLIDSIPTVDAVVLPFKPGGDYWWVDTDTCEIHHEQGGINGVVLYKDNVIKYIDRGNEICDLGGPFSCFSREEAEAVRADLLADANSN